MFRRPPGVVCDYRRTGPKDSILDGGRGSTLLYAFAVKALLGGDVEIRASLLYPRAEVDLRLRAPRTHAGYRLSKCVPRKPSIRHRCRPGATRAARMTTLPFALPANAADTCKRKKAAAVERLGDTTHVWEAP
jgi:hypothetical protein